MQPLKWLQQMLGDEWDYYCYCLFIATKIVLVFPPAFKGSVMIFVMYTNISAISLYFRFRHIYQEENHPFPSSVYRYIWCPTLPPHKNPPKEGIYHAVCQLALNQCWVFGMITQTSTVSKFIVQFSFFIYGNNINSKKHKKKWWNKILIKGR